MEDLFAAGGIGAVLRELKPLLHLDCMTVAGETLGQRLAAEAGPVDRAVVKPLADPLQPKGGLVALFGSLARRGRSSNGRPPTPGCSKGRVVLSSSPPSKTYRRASTIPISTSPRTIFWSCRMPAR